MPEEQELKLSVTLDDKASEQLARLQQTLSGLANAASNTTGLNNFAQGLANAGQHAQGLHGGLMGMIARGATVGGFFFEVGKQVAKMAEEFAEAVLDIKKYSDEMVRLDQNAQRAATSMAQFRSNAAVFRESGISAEQSTRMLLGYSNAIANLQRQDSTVRQDLMRGQQGASREAMQDLLKTIDTRSQQEGINAIRARGEEIKQYWTERGQAERGAAAEASFYAKLGMPGLENFRGVVREVSAAERKMYEDRDKDAKRFQTSIEQTSDSTDRVVKGLQSVAFQILPINAVSETLAHWWEVIARKAEEYDRNLRRAKISMENTPAPGWFEGGLFPTPEQVAARIRQRQAGEIVLHPPPVDQAPGGTFRGGGGTYGGGGLYSGDIEEGQELTPLPGEKPIPREWVEEAKKEWAKMPMRRPATTWPPQPPGQANAPLRPSAGPAISRFMSGEAGEGAGPDAAGPGAGGGPELQRAYEENVEQIDSLTEEFRRLNLFFEAAELSGAKPGAILGGRGPGPGGGIAPGGTAPGGGRPPSGGGDDGTSSNPPAQSQNPPAQATAQPAPGQPGGPGPYGQPMPAWGTTETGPADFGGGIGGGVAGGVQGVPGGPSGRALTPEERKAGGVIGGGGAAPAPAPAPAGGGGAAPAGGSAALGGGVQGAPIKVGPGGKVEPTSLYQNLVGQFRNSSLNGFVPEDGAKYGIKTGSPEEWARLGVALAEQESSTRTTASETNEAGQVIGQAGLYQFSQKDLRNRPSLGTTNIADPNAQATAMVTEFEKIRSNDPSQGGGQGSIAKHYGGKKYGGAAAYFGPFRRPTEVLKHMPYAQRIAQQAGAVPQQQQQPQQGTTQPPGAPVSTAGPNLQTDPDQKNRPFYIGGKVTMGGQTFDWGSGGGSGTRGSLPTGTFPINIGRGDIGTTGKKIGSVATVGNLGGEIPDPKYPGQPRLGIQIHPSSSQDLDRLYTAGCFAIPRAQWPAFKAKLLDMARDNPGGLVLNVGKDGRTASIVPRGQQPPQQNPPPTATAAAAAQPDKASEDQLNRDLVEAGRKGQNPQAAYDAYNKREADRKAAAGAQPAPSAQSAPGAPPVPPATTPPYSNPATRLYDTLKEQEKKRPGAPIDAQAPSPTIQDTLTRTPEEGAIVVPGTTLRAGRPPAKPPSILDLSTLDSAPAAQNVVNVNGKGKITVDVKSNSGEKSQKDEPLAKPVKLSTQESMKPAAPTGQEANAEE